MLQKLHKKLGVESSWKCMSSFQISAWIRMEGDGEPLHSTHWHKLLDVQLWGMCFASYSSVMASRDPRRVQDLLGCLVHIIKASLEFEGPAWANYDITFRRQAAALLDMLYYNGEMLVKV